MPSRRDIGVALVLMLAQTIVLMVLRGSLNLEEAYRSLAQWDSRWYEHIVRTGYHSVFPPAAQDPSHSNVAFFPGYPLAGWLIHQLTGLPADAALLLAAQLACWGFWVYVLSWLRVLGAGQEGMSLAVRVMISHPMAFFLVAGYSESLFLSALLGFTYWSRTSGRWGWALAAGHGCLMSATRLTGFPLVVAALYPPGPRAAPPDSAARKSRWARFWPRLLVTAAAAAGCCLFLGFCQWKFGHWDLYFDTQQAGWHLQVDFLAPLRPENYAPTPLPVDAEGVHANRLSRLAVPFTVLLGLGVLALEVGLARHLPSGSWKQRATWYWCAWVIFYISVCGVARVETKSLLRYCFPVHIVLVLAITQIVSQAPALTGRARRLLVAGLTVICYLSLALQLVLARSFVHGGWVG